MAKALQTWSPFRELDRFRRDFDDIFNRFFGAAPPEFFNAGGPPLESFVEGDKMVIRADLPGVDPKDVEITVTGNTLTLRGSRETRTADEGRDFLHREVRYGSFERVLTLPEGVKPDDVHASYDNGVLQLTVAMPKEMSPRKVPIQVASRTGEQASQPAAEKK